MGNDQKSASVLVLCINYHSDQDCLRLAKEILTGKNVQSLHLLFVDNSESPSLGKSLSTSGDGHGNVTVLFSGKNLGYFGGAAWGLEQFLLEHSLPEWVVVCNPDLHFLEGTFFDRLIAYGSSHRYAVMAPAIISGLSGADQNPFMRTRPTKVRMQFYSVLFRLYPALMLYSIMSLVKERFTRAHGRMSPGQSDGIDSLGEPQAIYAAHGACIAFRRQYFECGGDLRYGAFLFGEEIFVAETVRRLGLAIGYDPRLQVAHSEHRTTGHLPSRKMAAFMGQSAVYCANTFFRDGIAESNRQDLLCRR